MLKYIIAFSLGVYVGQEYTKLPKIKDQVEKSIKDIKDYFDKLK
jgi:hypothetical protein